MALLSSQYARPVSPIPIGSVQAYAGGAAPAGWLLCNGDAVSTGTYPDLFTVVGYAYGGSGATFNLPDLRGRMPIGAGNDGSAANNAARSRGDKSGDTRLQSHNHGGSSGNTDVNHGHSITVNYRLSGSQSNSFNIGDHSGSNVGPVTTNTAQSTGLNHSHTIPSDGLGGSGNMPPFLVTNYIIKALPDPALSATFGNTILSVPAVSGLPSAATQGDQLYDVSTGQPILYRYSGSAWQPVSLPSGSIVQTVVGRNDTRTTYSSNNSGNGTTVSALNLTITPRFANSQIICDWMINGELHQDNVFLIHKDGAAVANGNSTGNSRWMGMMAAFYDQNEDSTPSNWNLKYVDPTLGSTAARTYAPAVRSSSGSNYTFALNGTLSAASQDFYERMVSIGIAYEVIA
jgi:microcystin-dependent protein